MSLYVTRQAAGEHSAAELSQVLEDAAPAGAQPLAGYWTADDGELLGLYESVGGLAAGATGNSLQEVVPVTPEEYGPPDETSLAAGAKDLQLVLVRRQLEPLTPGEFRAIALQAIMCAYEYQDMRWLRSYWARETDQLFCLFETRSHDLVREHAQRSRIPCDEIHDAVEVLPQNG
jgi:hypothetical protein